MYEACSGYANGSFSVPPEGPLCFVVFVLLYLLICGVGGGKQMYPFRFCVFGLKALGCLGFDQTLKIPRLTRNAFPLQ